MQREFSKEEKSEFVTAAGTNKPDVVSAYLKAGMPPDVVVDYVTAFQMAAARGDLVSMELLKDGGANINFVSQAKTGYSYARTALNLAALNAQPDAVQWLLTHGANPRIPTGNGHTVAHLLAERMTGSGTRDRLYTWDFIERAVKHCLDEGLSASATTSEGLSILRWYADTGAPATLITLLIDHGADLEARDGTGATPLHFAVQCSRATIVETLIERGANIEAAAFNGTRPLHVCTDAKTMGVLLAAGPDLEALDLLGQTTLARLISKAGKRDVPPVLPMLLDAGASLDTPDFAGISPRDLMVSAKMKGVMSVVTAKLARTTMMHVAEESRNLPTPKRAWLIR